MSEDRTFKDDFTGEEIPMATKPEPDEYAKAKARALADIAAGRTPRPKPLSKQEQASRLLAMLERQIEEKKRPKHRLVPRDQILIGYLKDGKVLTMQAPKWKRI